MKKNVIALMIAMGLAAGSITTAPVMAVETTAEEAVLVEEAEEEQEEVLEEVKDAEADVKADEASESVETVDEENGQESGETTEESESSDDQVSDEEGSLTEESVVEGEKEKPSETIDETTVEEELIIGEENKSAGDVVASGKCGVNLTWTIEDGTLTISGTGKMTDYQVTGATWYNDYRMQIVKVVLLPGVTSIGSYAFEACFRLTSITIPDSVTSIGSYAFKSCSNLTSITIPESVTSIGEYAFSRCGLTSVTIPDSVTSIGLGVFQMSDLRNITIPDSVTSIGNSAFEECHSLTSITIPRSVTSIGVRTFSRCNHLMSVMIPDSVTSIGASAFDFSVLRSITIPDSVTSINVVAFGHCLELKNVYFKGNAPEIGINVFSNVSATAYYPYNNTTWTEDVRQNYGGDITWVPYDPETLSDIDLDPEFTCRVGDRIKISATYTGESKISSVSISSDAGDALEFSEVSIVGPVDNGDGQETIISFMVTGKEEGEYTVTLETGNGENASTVLKVVGEYDIANAEVLLLGKTYIDEEGTYCFNYTGKPIRPVYTVKMSNKYVLEEDEDYTLTYEDNTEVGTARCILEGIGDYYGEKIVEFLIVPVKASFESVESEFPGSCTAVVNTLSKSMLYKIDVQKDGRSIDGYPQEVGDVSNPDGSSATNSFKEYVDHLEEGETYTIRVCAIAKIGGKSYQSEWNESEVTAASVKMSPEEGYSFIAPTQYVTLELEFGEEDIKFTGEGKIAIHDDTDNKDVWVFVPDEDDPYRYISEKYTEDEDEAFVNSNKISIRLNQYISNIRLDRTDDLSGNIRLKAGHSFHIKVEDGTIACGDHLTWAGTDDKEKLCFKTIEYELPRYRNTGFDKEITGRPLAEQIFKPGHVDKIVKKSNLQAGICTGILQTVLAWKSECKNIHRIGNRVSDLGDLKADETGGTNTSFRDYMIKAQLYSMSPDWVDQRKPHDGELNSIYAKAAAGDDFIIAIGSNEQGHVLLPVGVMKGDKYDSIMVYDCNVNSQTMLIEEIRLAGSGGSYTGWAYGGFGSDQNENYITWYELTTGMDDCVIGNEKNLVYASKKLSHGQGEDLTEIRTQNAADGQGGGTYLYWTDSSSLALGIEAGTVVGISDGHSALEVIADSDGEVTVDLDSMTAAVVPGEGAEAQSISLGYENYTDYDHSTKIGITAAGSDQTTLKQTDNGWYLEGSVPGTITITMEASGPDGDEEKTNTEEIVVESATGRVELIEDNYHNLNVFEDTDGDGSGDKKVGSMELPNVPGKPMTGKCGDNLTWTLGKDRVLRISGTGEMYNYTNKSPWSKYDFTSVVIENGVTGIGNYAFSQCTFLNSVSIPPSLKNIGRYAFLYPIGGKRIYITDLEAWLRINDDISSLHGEVFLNNKQLTEVTIPDGIEYFKRSAFDGCSKLKSVIIPEGVKRIPSSAFSGCTNLKSVEIPKSVLDIWSNAFSRCSSLTEISLPEGLMYISNDVFNGCKNLTSVKIPLSLTRIDEQAFSGCTALKDVYYAGKRSDWDKITVGRSNDYLLNADIHCAGDIVPPGKTTRGDMFNLANNVKVTWKEVPGAKYYKVYREGVTDKKETRKEPVIVTAGLVGWDKDLGLTNGHAYRYKIVASLTGKGDSSGDSTLSYSKLMYRLKTVVIRSVKNTAPGKVTVKYDKTTSGDSYVLQYCERQDMVGAKTKVVLGANNTSYTIGGLKKGKTYYISIRVRRKVNGIDYYTTFGVPKKVAIIK